MTLCLPINSEAQRQRKNLPMNKNIRILRCADCQVPQVVHCAKEGQPPEAHHELFRDWQRTQTQSSATALRSPRLQMDVWFCFGAGTNGREAKKCVTAHPDSIKARSQGRSRAKGHLCFSLDFDLHRSGLLGPLPEFRLSKWLAFEGRARKGSKVWPSSIQASLLPLNH